MTPPPPPSAVAATGAAQARVGTEHPQVSGRDSRSRPNLPCPCVRVRPGTTTCSPATQRKSNVSLSLSLACAPGASRTTTTTTTTHWAAWLVAAAGGGALTFPHGLLCGGECRPTWRCRGCRLSRVSTSFTTAPRPSEHTRRSLRSTVPAPAFSSLPRRQQSPRALVEFTAATTMMSSNSKDGHP